jgi:hypothetical protein
MDSKSDFFEGGKVELWKIGFGATSRPFHDENTEVHERG